jgi:hypothetical protein
MTLHITVAQLALLLRALTFAGVLVVAFLLSRRSK